LAPSASTVYRTIKASEVPIEYGCNEESLEKVVTVAVETVHAVMVDRKIPDGSVMCIAGGDETALSSLSITIRLPTLCVFF